jgi:hypothetical protein
MRASCHKLHRRPFAGDGGRTNPSRWNETGSMIAECDRQMMLQAQLHSNRHVQFQQIPHDIACPIWLGRSQKLWMNFGMHIACSAQASINLH